jgi:hypothetical protein
VPSSGKFTGRTLLLGTTRAEMQADFDRRGGYASVANGLLAAGVAHRPIISAATPQSPG